MDTVLTGLGLVFVVALGEILGGFTIGYINILIHRHRSKGHQSDLESLIQSMKDASADPDDITASFPEGAIISTEEL